MAGCDDTGRQGERAGRARSSPFKGPVRPAYREAQVVPVQRPGTREEEVAEEEVEDSSEKKDKPRAGATERERHAQLIVHIWAKHQVAPFRR